MIKKLLLLTAVVAVLAGVGYANGTLANTTLRWPDIELGNFILFCLIILFGGIVIYGIDLSKVRPMTTDEWYTLFKNRSNVHPVSYGSLFDDDD